ncbi:MAG: response regulator transcription factor, partial [Patescibacteria group bacterium]|nr:response regulator transcription factor [Patescibacteria group bacterium]
MQVLVVEAYQPFAATLCLMLKSEGHTAVIASHGDDALYLAKEYAYDLILLDYDCACDDMTGKEVLRKMRGAKVNTPIIVMLTDPEIGKQIKILDDGADDVIPKSLRREFLLAKAHSVVRRAKGFAVTSVGIGDVRLDLKNRSATVDGNKVKLARKEYAILEALVMRRGNVLTKGALMDILYEDRPEEPDIKVLDVFICKLRRKLR